MSADDPLDQRKLAAARLFAASRYPYLASALFAAPVVAADDTGTIAVDPRWRVHADPHVVDGLLPADLGRLLVHLVSHVLREHARRAEGAGVTDDEGDPRAWNSASDAEINDDLARDGMVPASAGELPAGLGAADGRLAEQYYELAKGGGARWDCGSGCDGMPRAWDSDKGADGRPDGVGDRDAGWLRLAVAWEMQRAETAEPGSLAAGWLRWAETVLPSKTDWRRVLAAEIQAGVAHVRGMVDYTYRRPSRRVDASPGVVLPALERPVPDVAIVCDTSGSMTGEKLGRVLSEVEVLLERAGLRDTNVRVLSCDAEVHSIRRVSRASQIELVGGGGTDMAEGIAQAVALKPRPSIVVVLTDGLTPWPDEPPRGVRVVVGLIEPSTAGGRLHRHWGHHVEPPAWARTVRVSDESD
jgi:predicted metal-dependent peptidase